MQVHGFMFEKKQDEIYSEQFVYRGRADGKVNYDMFLFRDPGLMRIMRYKMFQWGIGSMQKIIDARVKLITKKDNATVFLKDKKDKVQTKAHEHIEKAKSKLPKM